MPKQPQASALDWYFHQDGSIWKAWAAPFEVLVWYQAHNGLWYWSLKASGQHTNCQWAQTREGAQRDALCCTWGAPALSLAEVQTRLEKVYAAGAPPALEKHRLPTADPSAFE
jgi:hypothetical protein